VFSEFPVVVSEPHDASCESDLVPAVHKSLRSGAGSRARRRRSAWLAGGLFSLVGQALATTATQYQLTPRDLGSGFTLAGSITTDGTLGTLGAANLSAWNLRVTEIVDTYYTQANTHNVSSALNVTGGALVLPTSPDGSADGGSLAFTGSRRFGVQVADFSGANVVGGQAFYADGAAFDFLPLHQAAGRDYVAASQLPGSITQFGLKPLDFSGHVQLTGTLTTDGVAGPAHLLAWNLRLRQTTTWRFDQHNSSVLADSGLTADGQTLTLTPFDADQNAGSFVIGAQGRFDTTAVMLADYLQDPAGQAGLITQFVYQSLGGLPLDAAGRVLLATAVPEPAAWVLLAGGGLSMFGARIRRRRPVLSGQSGPDRTGSAGETASLTRSRVATLHKPVASCISVVLMGTQ
jgi:hypothetical protein